MTAPRISPASARRFWAKVNSAGGLSACWRWQGAVNSNGYGNIWLEIDGERRCVEAHRAAYTLAKGPITAGLQVLHSCNRSLCVNPRHLSAGTPSENVRAALRDGLTSRCLSGKTVRQIVRARTVGAMPIEIAGRLGVRLADVRRVLAGRNWNFLTGMDRPVRRMPRADQLHLDLGDAA